MRICAFRAFLIDRYERLFLRRFDLENECLGKVPVVVDPPQRNRYRVSGSIFPTDPLLPRYQY